MTTSDPSQADYEPDHEAIARKILLDQLTGQARSRHELAGRLAKKNVPEEIAERLLDRFEEVGLIDDAAFAELWVESRHTSRGLAPRALRQELQRKGVAPDTIAEAVQGISTEDEQEAARALVRHKLARMLTLDREVAVRRLVGMLARKGYGPGMAYSVVMSEFATEDEDPDARMRQ